MKKIRWTKIGLIFTLIAIMIIGTACTNYSEQTWDKEVPITPFPAFQEGSTLSTEDRSFLLSGLEEIHQKGILTIGMFSGERIPFFYEDETGELIGLDVDLAKDIAAHLGVEVQFLRTAKTFDEVVNQVAMGEADIGLSKLSVTLDRAQRVSYTEPYLLLHQALLVNRLQYSQLDRRSNQVLSNLQLHQGIKVVAREGTIFTRQAERLFPQANILHREDVFEEVYLGNALAALYDEHEIHTFIKANPDKAIDVQVTVIDELVDPLAMAVSGDNSHLRDWLNLYLQIRSAYVVERIQHYGIIAGDG